MAETTKRTAPATKAKEHAQKTLNEIKAKQYAAENRNRELVEELRDAERRACEEHERADENAGARQEAEEKLEITLAVVRRANETIKELEGRLETTSTMRDDDLEVMEALERRAYEYNQKWTAAKAEVERLEEANNRLEEANKRLWEDLERLRAQVKALERIREAAREQVGKIELALARAQIAEEERK